MTRFLPGLAGDRVATQRLLIDVTRTLDNGLHTGIQRVVRGLYRGARSLAASRPDLSVHAVRCEGRYWVDVGELPAHPLERKETATRLHPVREPSRLVTRPGDTLLLADASWYVDPWPAVSALLSDGGELAGFVHDLLPAQRPEWFRPGTSAAFCSHLDKLLSSASTLFVSSEHVRAQLDDYGCSAPLRVLPLASSLELGGLSLSLTELGEQHSPPFFLCVATLEPRKNHALILDAFEHLWRGGNSSELHLVGTAGWCNDALLQRIRQHPEIGRRLHWLTNIDDTQLIELYQRAQALIYVPDDEGFGLPVLEGRHLGCPVLASDIPPLREAGGAWPRYLPPRDVNALVMALKETLRAPRPPAQYTLRNWQNVAGELLHGLASQAPATLPRTGTDA